MSECPVCYSETKYTTEYENYYLSEESDECPRGCYSYEYSYGSSAIFIPIRGHVISFYWSYNDTGQRDRHDAINTVVLAARKALIEDLLKLRVTSEDNKATSR
jgi:hypothetical protein